MTARESSLAPTVIGASHNERTVARTVARTGDDDRTEIVRVLDRQNQKRSPNFEEGGQWYMVRCFTCSPNGGRENWAMAVATGQCCWCGDKIGEGND